MTALPSFITKGLNARPTKGRKRLSKAAPRFAGDTGTAEMKQRQAVVIEARQRSLKRPRSRISPGDLFRRLHQLFSRYATTASRRKLIAARWAARRQLS
jgi:hypothetical protein